MMEHGFSVGNQLLADADRKCQVGEVTAVQVPELAPADAELDETRAVRGDGDVRPACDRLGDAISDCQRESR